MSLQSFRHRLGRGQDQAGEVRDGVHHVTRDFHPAVGERNLRGSMEGAAASSHQRDAEQRSVELKSRRSRRSRSQEIFLSGRA